MWNLVLPGQVHLFHLGTTLISSGFLHKHPRTETTALNTWTWHGGAWAGLIFVCLEDTCKPTGSHTNEDSSALGQAKFGPSLPCSSVGRREVPSSSNKHLLRWRRKKRKWQPSESPPSALGSRESTSHVTAVYRLLQHAPAHTLTSPLLLQGRPGSRDWILPPSQHRKRVLWEYTGLQTAHQMRDKTLADH